MRILIVGAGLGGLTAAIGFSRKGHDVEVLEQKDRLLLAGGGLNVRPGASRVLHSWGLKGDLESISEDTPAVIYRNIKTGDVASRAVATDATPDPDWSTHRSNLIELLYRKATGCGAKIRFGVMVVRVKDDARQAVVVMKDGSEREADLILAADGIRSRLRSQIAGISDNSIDPFLSNLTLYGVRLDQETIQATPELWPLKSQHHLNIYMGKDRWVVSKFNSKLGSHSFFFGIKGETDQSGLWDENGNLDFVRSYFQDSCAELRKALQVVKSCNRWKLAEIPNLPTWSSKEGRILILGDSAHAMHPNAAHGFSQTVEDVGALEYLISASPDPAADMSIITSDWEMIRKPRVERIKDWAAFNSTLFTSAPPDSTIPNTNWQIKSLKQTKPDMHAHFNSAAFLKWTLCYDAVEEARAHAQDKKSKL
ncbi:hypothetical protein F5Y15DRAFT_374008 [Xylariaceae sp. FL0016]|nr:hypothetical protein F5Y15DRAFT_374008 [Xylariaceae sp. FL0016]